MALAGGELKTRVSAPAREKSEGGTWITFRALLIFRGGECNWHFHTL